MRFIRFIQIGSSNNTVIHNIVMNLNFVQTQFRFLFEDDIIALPEDINVEQPVSASRLEQLAIEYTFSKSLKEYPVAICDCPLEDELFISNDNKVALISTNKWAEEMSTYPVQNGIIYALVDILLDLFFELPVHYETRGCPMDYCDKKGDLKIGLSKCDFCFECRSQIIHAVARGLITLQQMVAIYKILDFVAGRKICFVIMPFDKKFDRIYEYIKSTLVNCNWECRRSDDIREPREIINLILEQILRADLIIADLTGRNANVFYELGYAHAWDKNTILITQFLNDAPFDLRHRQLLEYSATQQGCKELSRNIKKYIVKQK